MSKKANAEQVWKQFEDHLAPRLHLSKIDRVVYSHLVPPRPVTENHRLYLTV
jgi:hypothetical protein